MGRSSEGKFVFKRSDRPEFDKQLITNIFTRAQQKSPPSPYLPHKSFVVSTNRKSSINNGKEDIKAVNKSSFKSVERKVAAVVKDGFSGSGQLNIFKLREEHEMELLGVDFEAEKSLHERQTGY